MMNQAIIKKQKDLQDVQKLTEQEIQQFSEKQKYEPIYSPRTSLKRKRDEFSNLLSELLLKLDPFTICILNNDFQAAGGCLRAEEFVIMMRHHLSDWRPDLSNREKKMNICLLNLFDQIDLNQNGILEWEELATYVMGKATVINSMKQQRKDVVKQYSKQTPFRMNYKVITNIKKVVYISEIDKVAFFEEGTNVVQIASHETGNLSSKPLKIEPDDYHINSSSIKKDTQGLFYVDEKLIEIKRRTLILDMIYINDKKHKYLMVSSTDKYVRAFRISNNGFQPAVELKNNSSTKIQKIFRNEVTCMAWDEQREILVCGEIEGTIELWNMNMLDLMREEQSDRSNYSSDAIAAAKTGTAQEATLNRYILSGGHKDVITSLICLPKLQFTASASLDGKINLWDTSESKLKITYKGHTRGITSLAYNPSTILLFSAGFDHWVGVWNPYTDHMVFKISDYRFPLQQVLVVHESNQLISLDVKGNIQVRDIQKFKECQSILLEKDEQGFHFNATHFCYARGSNLKLIFGGQSLAVFHYDITFNPNVCDDTAALCCIMNTSQLKLYTPTGPRLKVWCCLTGEVDKIFLDMSNQNSEITAFCLDASEKSIIIGDQKGYVSSFNCENGAKIMTLPRHNAPVIIIKCCEELSIIVTASSDNVIHIVTSDYNIEKDALLRSIHIPEQTITCLDIYLEFASVVVGFTSGVVAFFEISSGKFLGQSNPKISHSTNKLKVNSKNESSHNNTTGKYNAVESNYDDNDNSLFEITDVLAIPDIPFIIASNSNGSVFFISGPPLFYKFQAVERFSNEDQELLSSESREVQDVGIAKMRYCKVRKCLFVADFKGYLKCYDVSSIINNIYENISRKPINSGTKHSIIGQAVGNKAIAASSIAAAAAAGAHPSLTLNKHQLYSSMREYHESKPNNDISNKANVAESTTSVKVLSYVKATSDMITNLEYNHEHSLLFVCTSDKSVQIFNSSKIEFIEQLQQNEANYAMKPIGFRQKNTLDLFDESLSIRIDRTKEEDEIVEKQLKQEYMYQLKKQIKQQKRQQNQVDPSTVEDTSRFQSPDLLVNAPTPVDGGTTIIPSHLDLLAEQDDDLDHRLIMTQEPLVISKSQLSNNLFEGNNGNKSQQQQTPRSKPGSTQNMSRLMSKESNEVSGNTDDQSSENNDGSSAKLGDAATIILEDKDVFLMHPECEFDPFYFCNRIKKEPYLSMKSKPWWKLEIDFSSYKDDQQDRVNALEAQVIAKEKRTKIYSIPRQKFKIVRFEVDLKRFDPSNDFRPKIKTSKKIADFLPQGEDNLDPSTIAINYYKKRQHKLEKITQSRFALSPASNAKYQQSEIWDDLSKSKKNCRNQDSERFLANVLRYVNLSEEEMVKVQDLYEALRAAEQNILPIQAAATTAQQPIQKSQNPENNNNHVVKPVIQVFKPSELNNNHNTGTNPQQQQPITQKVTPRNSVVPTDNNNAIAASTSGVVNPLIIPKQSQQQQPEMVNPSHSHSVSGMIRNAFGEDSSAASFDLDAMIKNLTTIKSKPEIINRPK